MSFRGGGLFGRGGVKREPPQGLIREWALICQIGSWGRGLIREGGYSIIYGSINNNITLYLSSSRSFIYAHFYLRSLSDVNKICFVMSSVLKVGSCVILKNSKNLLVSETRKNKERMPSLKQSDSSGFSTEDEELDCCEEKKVKNIRILFQKKFAVEKSKHCKERRILKNKIKDMQYQNQFDAKEREEICRMYLQQNDKCLHLQEEKLSRDLFVKEVLKLLKERTEELRSLKKDCTTPKTPSNKQHQQLTSKKKIKRMFFDDSKKEAEYKKEEAFDST